MTGVLIKRSLDTNIKHRRTPYEERSGIRCYATNQGIAHSNKVMEAWRDDWISVPHRSQMGVARTHVDLRHLISRGTKQ